MSPNDAGPIEREYNIEPKPKLEIDWSQFFDEPEEESSLDDSHPKRPEEFFGPTNYWYLRRNNERRLD